LSRAPALPALAGLALGLTRPCCPTRGVQAATVAVRRVNEHAEVEIRDDGVGGADPCRGSGLRGLADRVGALDGSLALDSPPGSGTTLRAEIPV
jgi:signal transduction histidine kinase